MDRTAIIYELTAIKRQLNRLLELVDNGQYGPNSLDAIKWQVCKSYGISMNALVGRTRTAKLVHARRVVAKLALEQGFKYKQIVGSLGLSNHTTVINWMKDWEQRINDYPEYAVHAREAIRFFNQ